MTSTPSRTRARAASRDSTVTSSPLARSYEARPRADAEGVCRETCAGRSFPNTPPRYELQNDSSPSLRVDNRAPRRIASFADLLHESTIDFGGTSS